MNRMAADRGASQRQRIRPARAVLVSVIVLASIAVAGCGDSDEASVDTTVATTSQPSQPAVNRSTTSIAPTPTSASTSTSTGPSTSTSTSTTTTTTVFIEPQAIVLPQPISPPLDINAIEPVVEVGSIEIPAIGVYTTMYEGIRLTTLDHGPGHWPGSAMPGKVGNTVVAGHRTSKHKVFRNIDQLVPGDEIIFDGVDGRHVYHVTSIEIVEPADTWIIDQTSASTATLFACHPPGSTRERIVVFAALAT
jgi:sortase A